MANRWKGNIIAAAATTSSGTDYTGKANGAWGLNSQLQQKQGGLWAKGQTVPDAPTGVSGAAGNQQVVVSFTAPLNTNGSSISSYTVTSSPGGFTASGSSSPLTVTGLTNGTAYTFTAIATNNSGNSVASSPSSSVTPTSGPTVIGQVYGGGFYAGQINDAGTLYYLVVAPKATGQASTKAWGPSGVTTGFTSRINGPVNSSGLAALGSSYAAATFCEGLTIGGYSDWYLPATNEIEVLYYYFKPGTTGNSNVGANPNAVAPEPINTNYTSGSPAQTTVTDFVVGGSEAFIENIYWASTEFSSTSANWKYFDNGNQAFDTKTSAYYVRAIRRVAV